MGGEDWTCDAGFGSLTFFHHYPLRVVISVVDGGIRHLEARLEPSCPSRRACVSGGKGEMEWRDLESNELSRKSS
jgi:hypothetical protein